MSNPRTITVVATALVVLLAGCSGGDDGSGERARTVTPATSAPPEEVEGGGETLTEAQLQAALLTVADLPTGYTASADDEEDEEDDSQTTSADADCAERFEELGADEGSEAARAEAKFEGGFGVVLEQTLESYEDEDPLKERFDEVVAVLSECPSFTDTDEQGTTTEVSISALSFPKLGDDTIALALTGKVDDFDLRLNIALVRLGRNVMYISQGGLTADAAALEQVSRTGLAKLAAAGE